MLSSFKVLVKGVFSLIINSAIVDPLVAIILNKRVTEGQYMHLIDYRSIGFFFLQSFIFHKDIMVYQDILVTDNPTKTIFHCQRTPPLLILISDLHLLFSSIWQPTEANIQGAHEKEILNKMIRSVSWKKLRRFIKHRSHKKIECPFTRVF